MNNSHLVQGAINSSNYSTGAANQQDFVNKQFKTSSQNPSKQHPHALLNNFLENDTSMANHQIGMQHNMGQKNMMNMSREAGRMQSSSLAQAQATGNQPNARPRSQMGLISNHL